MTSLLALNVILSSDDDWLPESLPCVHESSIAMRRKIGKFENAVSFSYVKHQVSSDIVNGVAGDTVEQFSGFNPSWIDRFEDFADYLKDRALKGKLKTKQELEEEKKEKARKAHEFEKSWSLYTAENDPQA